MCFLTKSPALFGPPGRNSWRSWSPNLGGFCGSHCPRSIPALGQGSSCSSRSFPALPPGLAVLVSKELLMSLQMLQGAHLHSGEHKQPPEPRAAPARGSGNQSREGDKKRGLQPKLCEFFRWLCLFSQIFLVFCLSSPL